MKRPFMGMGLHPFRRGGKTSWQILFNEMPLSNGSNSDVIRGHLLERNAVLFRSSSATTEIGEFQNLCRRSEELHTTGWDKSEATATDSGNGMALVTDNTVNAGHFIFQQQTTTVKNGDSLRIDIDFAADVNSACTTMVVLVNGGALQCNINLVNGTASGISAGLSVSAPRNVGTHKDATRWQVTLQFNQGGGSLRFYTHNGSGVVYSGSTANPMRFYVGRIWARRADTTKSYFQTQAIEINGLVSSGIGLDDPRIGDLGTGRGLVIEPGRTNLLTFSTAINDAAWTKRSVTLVANSTDVVDPAGGSAAEKLTTTGEFLQQRVQHAVSFTPTANEKVTISAWVYPGAGMTVLGIRWGTNGTTAVGGFTDVPVTAGQWQRVKLDVTLPADPGTSTGMTIMFYVGTANDNDATVGRVMYLWGVQFERDSLHLVTSTIITAGATLARSADRLNVARSSFIGKDGRLRLEFDLRATLALGQTPDYVHLVQADTTPSAYIAGNGSLSVSDGTIFENFGASDAANHWTRGDRLRIYIEIGSGPPFWALKRNDVPAFKATGVSNHVALATTGTSNLLTDNAGGLRNFASIVHAIRTYDPGKRPAWAA